MNNKISFLFFTALLLACSIERPDEPKTIPTPAKGPATRPSASPSKIVSRSEAKNSEKENNIDRQLAELQKQIHDARIEKIGNEIKITFNSQILFDVNSDQLEPGAQSSLDQLAKILNRYPETLVEVSGHTDNTGNEAYNMQLSKKRAASVARYTVNQGVIPTRFRIKGYGESIPIASNSTKEGRKLNRRVEISIKGNELLNKNLASTVNAHKDSLCTCFYDEYKNYVCRKLCDSWPVPSSALKFNKALPKNNTSFKEVLTSAENEDYSTALVRENLLQRLEESNTVIIAGKVTERGHREPTKAKIHIKKGDTGEELLQVETDSITGKYSILLEKGKNYSIMIEEDGYFMLTDNLFIPDRKGFTAIRQDMEIAPAKAGQKLELNHVFFERSKAVLLNNSYEQLNEVVHLMQVNKRMIIELHGHTDGIGDPQLNFKLSEKRVLTIKNYLTERGIEAERIFTKAFGGSRPIASNEKEETRKLNRRVEFLIISN